MNTTTRATLNDVAREAGVSLATVDRVLNKRPGVHARTVNRVADAVARLGYRPDPSAARLARPKPHRVCFVLPAGNNSFVAMLRDQVTDNLAWASDHRVTLEVASVDVFDPAELAERLRSTKGAFDTVVVVANDHPLVRTAIDDLVDAGLGVVTLVSDAPSSRRHRYVGIDNVAAGRTAATLMGRFLAGRPGEVGVVAGSLALRDHAERWFGFGQVMASEFLHLKVLPPLEGKDDSLRTEPLVRELLAAHPRLIGLYSLGAGNRGIAAALRDADRARDVVFVAHELTPYARRELLSGTMDAVINQDAGHEVRSALRQALSRLTREPVLSDQERIRIDIYVKDNLP